MTFAYFFSGCDGNNIILFAASRGKLKLMKFFFENCPMADSTVTNDLNETPLHLAAGYFTMGNILQ